MFKGGAERVAAGVSGHLLSLGWDCTWLTSPAWADSVPAGLTLGEGLRGLGGVAFSMQAQGDPGVVLTAAQMLDLVGTANLVVVVDRAVGAIPNAGRRVLLLSNLAYANERRAAAADECQSAWVPSKHLARRLVANHGWPADAVHIVPPAATAAAACTPATHAPVARADQRLAGAARPRARRLLFPHRADPGKGLASALRLLGRLVADDDRWALIVSRANHREGPAASEFIDRMATLAEVTGVSANVEWVPWLPASEIPCLYGLAGCTLVASTLDEGFGLVPVESICAGIPVVTLGTGNLRHLAVNLSGVHQIDAIDSSNTADLVRGLSGALLTENAVNAARRAYGATQQRAAVNAALGASRALQTPEPSRGHIGVGVGGGDE